MNVYTSEVISDSDKNKLHRMGLVFFNQGRPCVVLRQGDAYVLRFYRQLVAS